MGVTVSAWDELTFVSCKRPGIWLSSVADDAAHTSPLLSSRCGQQVAHPHQVVPRQCKGEHPLDSGYSAVTRLAQPCDGLEPAEDLFDPFALGLTDGIAGVAGGAGIDSAVGLARDVRCDLMVTQFLNELLAVIALIRTQGHSAPARNLFHQAERGLRLGPTGRLVDATSHRQPLAIVHQHVPGIAELGLLARSLARQPSFGVGGRLMGIVGAPLAVKVDAGVVGIVILRGLGLGIILGLEALVPGPRLDQGAVNRKVLVAEQPLGAGLFDHRREKTVCDPPLSSRSRFLLNVVASHTGSSMLSPTNQRNRKL